MTKSMKNKSMKNKTKNVKKTCKLICGKTKNILGDFVRNKRYLNKLNKKCKKSCVKKYTRKTRTKNQKGGSTTGIFPTILSNLIDSVSHSTVSSVDMLNGYQPGSSPLPFMAHYKSLL